MKIGVALFIASTLAVSAAFAAELPTRAARPNPDANAKVRTCTVDGQRGITLPGSDTCVRITGSVSAAVYASSPSH